MWLNSSKYFYNRKWCTMKQQVASINYLSNKRSHDSSMQHFHQMYWLNIIIKDITFKLQEKKLMFSQVAIRLRTCCNLPKSSPKAINVGDEIYILLS